MTLPDATPEVLPRWRGFNLLEKFILEWPSSGPFREKDFQLIAELGFNFVRLPMDYRFWIVDGDWERIDEAAFADLDEALEFGEHYNIHVCMNFHRAPGHTVATPPEPTVLWEDREAQWVCAKHWRFFARRYKGIPNSRLSFNLFNEPHSVDGETYAFVVKIMADAIRDEDPDRLIIVDGLETGAQPCLAVIPLRVAQATRGYAPASVSHYKATWFQGAESWPEPEWPARDVGGGFLYGPIKREMHSPMTVTTNALTPMSLSVTVGEVSLNAQLRVCIDGEEVVSETFTPGPGEGPWKESIYHPEYRSYRGVYDTTLAVPVPPGTRVITLDNVEGDWLSVTRLAWSDDEREYDALSILPKWGGTNVPLSIDARTGRIETERLMDAQWLWEDCFAQWAALREQGVGVFVGEWGTFNRTPHDVTLRWMEDNLRTFDRAGLGWALWNLRGGFGILDSDREDAAYEPFHGHLLDRKMLELLQRY